MDPSSPIQGFSEAWTVLQSMPLTLKFVVLWVVSAHLDVLSGVGAGWATHTLSSKLGRRGLARKFLTAVGMLIAGLFQMIVPNMPIGNEAAAYLATSITAGAVVSWYILIEWISINENLERGGVTIPLLSPVLKALSELSFVQQMRHVRPAPVTPILPPPVAQPAVPVTRRGRRVSLYTSRKED